MKTVHGAIAQPSKKVGFFVLSWVNFLKFLHFGKKLLRSPLFTVISWGTGFLSADLFRNEIYLGNELLFNI